jgi:hypothetical protein
MGKGSPSFLDIGLVKATLQPFVAQRFAVWQRKHQSLAVISSHIIGTAGRSFSRMLKKSPR